MSDERQQQKQNDFMILFFALAALILAGPYLFLYFFEEETRTALYYVTIGLLYPLQFLAEDASQVREAMVNYGPESFSLDTVWKQYILAMEYMRWVAMALIGLTVWHSLKIRNLDLVFNRRLNMEKLIREQSKNFPMILPVVDRKLDKEPLDEGPWRVPRTQAQMAAEHGLLRNNQTLEAIPYEAIINPKNGNWRRDSWILQGQGEESGNRYVEMDYERARALFEQQLGPGFSTPEAMADYKRALAGAFMAHGLGNKDEAEKLLNHINRTWQEPGRPYRKGPLGLRKGTTSLNLDVRGPMVKKKGRRTYPYSANSLIAKYKDNEEVQNAIRHHTSYEYSYLMALYLFAKRKGVIVTSYFIWLRPLDPELFMTLNQVGPDEDVFRILPWPEAAGSWSHFLMERIAQQPILEPCVEPALSGLERDLKQEGWIYDPEDPFQQ